MSLVARDGLVAIKGDWVSFDNVSDDLGLALLE